MSCIKAPEGRKRRRRVQEGGVFNRMKGDYQLAIITLFGVCAVGGVLPFGVYRLLNGDHAAAILDGCIAGGVALVVATAWHTGRTRRPGMCMAGVINIGAAMSAWLLGDIALFWAYAVLMANFFLVPHRVATLLAVLLIGGLVLHGGIFSSALHMASFGVSSLLVSMLALVLAHWTDHQRRQLELLATRDALTGLKNRRAMEQDLQQAILLSRRSRTPYGLAIVDLDHFKRINDRYGHAAGDDVLAGFAGLLRKSVRQVDGVYRFGGEEFLVLLPGADTAGLQTVVSTLRARIAAHMRSPDGKLTASLGAATLRPGESAETWFARADAALYRAKGLGRDRACVDGGEGDIRVVASASAGLENAGQVP